MPEKPLLVSTVTACALLGIGSSTFWSRVKSGRIQMAETGGRRMVVYASLEALAQPMARLSRMAQQPAMAA